MKPPALTIAIVLSFTAATHCGNAAAQDPWAFESKDLSGAINANEVAGSTTYDPDSDNYTVVGGGSDLWLQEDGFRFVYVQVPAEVGDFELSASVSMPLDWPHAWTKAGIMARQDLDADSAHVALCATRDNGIEMLQRPRKGAFAQHTGSPDRLAPYADGTLLFRINPPVWLKIAHQGNTFTGFYSYDGAEWLRQPPWDQHSSCSVALEGPYYVGFCLSSYLPDTPATAVFGDFKFPGLARPVADAGPDQWMYGNEVATLNGSKSANAAFFQWTQIKVGSEPTVTIYNANQAIAAFTPPGTQIGYTLTFRLTVTGDIGKDTDTVRYFVRAVNPPKVAPSNFRIYPIDQGGVLGFRLLWDPVFDAEKYQGCLKWWDPWPGLYSTTNTYLDFTGIAEGQEMTVAVRGENKFSDTNPTSDPSKHGNQSWDVLYKAIRNLALPASLKGGYPPSSYVHKVQPFSPGGPNNLNVAENLTSYEPHRGKLEDYWGYLWENPYYLEWIVYYTGEVTGTGGWFTSLSVQATLDGTTWTHVPILRIDPPYDLTDSPFGRKA